MHLIHSNEVFDQVELKPFQALVGSSESIQSVVDSKRSEWVDKFEDYKIKSMPYESHYQNCQHWMNSEVDSVKSIQAMFNDYALYCVEVGIETNKVFWEKQFYLRSITGNKIDNALNISDDCEISVELLLGKWSSSLFDFRAKWELEALNQYRLDLINELKKILEMFESMFKGLESLGLEPGRWLDLSDGVLTEQDIETFQYWANYFSSDEGANAICAKLGRLNEVEATENIERVAIQHRVQKWLPDTNSREEIVGIKLGRDIEHALPSELALLSDPETALLFDLKYVEGQLMSYDLQGLQQVEEVIEIEEDQSVEEIQEKGPMILCIDTSGSMHGEPENIAKAMALFLANKAKQKNRACYLINFSTGIETLDLSGSGGLSSLIRFLSSSFHGGTDAAPALRHGLSMMSQQTYEKADILVISDFIMGGMPSDILDGIKSQRLLGSQFYSLVVGNCFMSNRLDTLFDHEWVYNPSSSVITDLVNFHHKSEIFENKEVSCVKSV